MRKPSLAMLTLAWFVLLQVGDQGVSLAWIGLGVGVGVLYVRGGFDFERALSSLERSVLWLLAAMLLSAAFGAAPMRSLLLSVPAIGACLVGLLLARGEARSGDEVWVGASLGLAVVLQLALMAWQALHLPAADAATWVAQAGANWLLVPNDIVWMACCLPLLAQTTQQRSVTTALALLALFCGICVWLHSRTAAVVAIASVGTYCVLVQGLWQKARRWFAPLALLGVVSFVAAVLLIPSMQARAQLWRAAWDLFLQHPISGVGPHNFVLSYRQAAGLSAAVLIDPRLTPWPHNLWLEVAAELGALGLLAVSLFMVASSTAARRLLAVTGDRLSLAALGALSGLLVASLVEASLLRTWLWITGAIVFGVLARERPTAVVAPLRSG